VGAVDCDYSVRRSNLAAAAFRADAGSQSVRKLFFAAEPEQNECTIVVK
jgi:hypothetical protein